MLYSSFENLELNLKFLLDIVFLKDGLYRNISQGSLIGGIDASKLVLDTDSSSDFGGISGAQVWQSPFQQWIYESGIVLNNVPYISSLAPPIIASGIYVNNQFFSTNTGVSGNIFHIDYHNGRIIFEGTGIPENSDVKCSYAYKFYRLDFVDGNSALDEISVYSETRLKDNPLAGDVTIYPLGDNHTAVFPCIYIEVDDLPELDAMEIGNRSQLEKYVVYLHIYTLNRKELNIAKGLLKDRKDYHGWLVDYNYAPLPLSGLQNTLSPDYMAYQELLTNPVINGATVVTSQFSIDDVRIKNMNSDGPFLKAVTTYNITVYNIAPTGRIQNNTYIG